ncbi:Nipped-B-Like Protein [Manis pentadactyla]|nr:Nipped-B-Like Protein [Manis pentadactyla]
MLGPFLLGQNQAMPPTMDLGTAWEHGAQARVLRWLITAVVPPTFHQNSAEFSGLKSTTNFQTDKCEMCHTCRRGQLSRRPSKKRSFTQNEQPVPRAQGLCILATNWSYLLLIPMASGLLVFLGKAPAFHSPTS